MLASQSLCCHFRAPGERQTIARNACNLLNCKPVVERKVVPSPPCCASLAPFFFVILRGASRPRKAGCLRFPVGGRSRGNALRFRRQTRDVIKPNSAA